MKDPTAPRAKLASLGREALRRDLRTRIQGLRERPDYEARCTALLERLTHTLEALLTQGATGLAVFAPLADEPPVNRCFSDWQKRGWKLHFPRMGPESSLSFHAVGGLPGQGPDWVQAQHGIWEPSEHAPTHELDTLAVVLVPGLGFSPAGVRLGRGKGYYDRALAGCRRVRRVSAAFEEQVIEDLPTAEWDQDVHFVVTDRRVLKGAPS